jgi:hypothetical protein
MKRSSGVLSFVTGIVLAPLLFAGCSAAAEDETTAPFTVSVEQSYLTIKNQSGSAFADGLIELVPSGVLAPYRTKLPRIESGANHDVRFDLFAGVGGARFRRGGTRIKAVRVTATDVVGKTYKREVPFQ